MINSRNKYTLLKTPRHTKRKKHKTIDAIKGNLD